jgi:hypothetical protein
MKTEQQNFSLPQRYFIEQLACMIKKPPNKHDEELKKLESLIRWLKSKNETRTYCGIEESHKNESLEQCLSSHDTQTNTTRQQKQIPVEELDWAAPADPGWRKSNFTLAPTKTQQDLL